MVISLEEHARRELERLGKDIKELERRLKHYPEGRLVVYVIDGYRRCYQAYQDPKTHKRVRKYISKAEKVKMQRLAQKTLGMEDLQEKKAEYKRIQAYLDGCAERLPAMERRISNVPEICAMADYIPPLSQEYKEWEAEDFRTNSYPNRTPVTSVLGVDVRSKSEAYIAARLKARGLAVRYECELQLNHSKVYPDFTIMDPRTNRIYYWEHLGRMDTEDYAAHASNKLDEYAKAGYYPMKNLIITSETDEEPLDLKFVDYLIDYFFA